MIDRLKRMRDDSGAMLVIAMAIVTTVALVTTAILTHAWTNFRASTNLRAVAGSAYAADAAGKLAINNLRLGATAPGWQTPSIPGLWDYWVYTNNADGAGCFGLTDGPDGDTANDDPRDDLVLNNVYPAAGNQTAASSARVECSPVPGTGIFGGGSGVGIEDPDPTDAFARALTTVGTSDTLGITGVAGHGITVNPLGTGGDAPMPMRGGVASRSFINVESGALVTDGYVKANGNCFGAGDIIAGVDENNVEQQFCNSPGSVPVPNVPASPLSAVPSDFRDPSDYTGSCTFPPGFYNNAAALSTAVNSCTTARFSSGAYYFDFVDEEHGGDNIWEIDTTVIGGVGTSDTTIPGRCQSPITNDPTTGVQFVFGNNSRIEATDRAHVELCGPSNGGEAPMTLYQQQSGSTADPVSLTGVSAGAVDQKTGNSGGDKWTSGVINGTAGSIKAAINAPDTDSVTWTIADTNGEVGLDLTDFPGLSTIPAGSDISSAQFRVKYSKTTTDPNDKLTVTVKDETPAAVEVGAPDPGTGWGEADIAEQLRSALQDGAFSATRPVLELRLMNATKDDTLTIDAVQLSLTYVPPTMRATTDVMFINALAGNFQGEFVIQGATYAPTGYVRLVPGSDDGALVAFRWGLVAMGVDFKAQPSQVFGYPLVSIPDAGTGLGSRTVVVDLKIFVCVEQATCASGGTPALTARVMITDPPYNTSGTYEGIPEPGQRKMQVLSWAEQN